MKKLIFTVFLFTYLISCKKDVKHPEKSINKPESIEILNSQIDTKPITNKLDSVKYNFDYIKSKSKPLTKDIVIDNINVEKSESIPLDFISELITPHKIDFGYPEKLFAEYPDTYKFIEYKEFEEFNFFTFTYDDETCCRTLYGVTTNKNKLSIINIGVLAYRGGDGGWSGERSGKWFNEYSIENTEISIYDQDGYDNPNDIKTDTIWSELQVNKLGKFKYIEHNKVKYKGNKRIE